MAGVSITETGLTNGRNVAMCKLVSVCYTYTPTVQNKATTPKPPRILAVEATASSFAGNVLFGSLQSVVRIHSGAANEI